MKTLELKQENWKPKKYFLLREETSVFNGLGNDNTVEALLQVEPLYSRESKETQFRIRIEKYKQSNTKGMYEWVGLLHNLKENIVINVDDNGMLRQVKNMQEVRQKWEGIKNFVYEKQKKETPYALSMMKQLRDLIDDSSRFSRILKFVYPYLYLFPPIFNKELSTDKKSLGYRELPHLLNISKVPIITEEYIKEYIPDFQEVEVVVDGKIDEENFQQEQLTQMIKMLKNRPRVPTLGKLNYIERYRFNADSQLKQAMCMSLFTVPGSIYREEKTIIKEV